MTGCRSPVSSGDLTGYELSLRLTLSGHGDSFREVKRILQNATRWTVQATWRCNARLPRTEASAQQVRCALWTLGSDFSPRRDSQGRQLLAEPGSHHIVQSLRRDEQATATAGTRYARCVDFAFLAPTPNRVLAAVREFSDLSHGVQIFVLAGKKVADFGHASQEFLLSFPLFEEDSQDRVGSNDQVLLKLGQPACKAGVREILRSRTGGKWFPARPGMAGSTACRPSAASLRSAATKG